MGGSPAVGLPLLRVLRVRGRLSIVLLVAILNLAFFLVVLSRERQFPEENLDADENETENSKNNTRSTVIATSHSTPNTAAPWTTPRPPPPDQHSQTNLFPSESIPFPIHVSLSDIALSSEERDSFLTPFDVEDFRTLGERVRAFFHYHRKLRAIEDYQTNDRVRFEDVVGQSSWLKNENEQVAQIPLEAHNIISEFTRFMSRFEALLFPWVRPTFPSLSYLYRSFSRAPRTRGMVMTTAQGLQSRMAMVGIMSLRSTGCLLPIEFMYAGDDDLPPETRRQILSLGDGYDIVMRDITALVDDTITQIGEWAIKPFAIMFSSFTEVVFSDADVVWFHPPEDVFDDPVYKQTGTLFYYDRRTFFGPSDRQFEFVQEILPPHLRDPIPSFLQSHNAIMARQSEHNQDSAVVAVDKGREHNFYGLLTTCRLNLKEERDRVIYKVFLGDKETFWLGWEMSGNNGMYGFNRWPSAQVGYLSRGDQDPVEVVTHLNFTIDSEKAHESSILRICSYHSAHLDASGTRLHWFNGGPLRAKFFGEKSDVASRLEYWAVERHSRWDINDFNVFCLRMREGLNITVDENGQVFDSRPSLLSEDSDLGTMSPVQFSVFEADYEHHDGGAVPHRLGRQELRVVAKLKGWWEESAREGARSIEPERIYENSTARNLTSFNQWTDRLAKSVDDV